MKFIGLTYQSHLSNSTLNNKNSILLKFLLYTFNQSTFFIFRIYSQPSFHEFHDKKYWNVSPKITYEPAVLHTQTNNSNKNDQLKYELMFRNLNQSDILKAYIRRTSWHATGRMWHGLVLHRRRRQAPLSAAMFVVVTGQADGFMSQLSAVVRPRWTVAASNKTVSLFKTQGKATDRSHYVSQVRFFHSKFLSR